jgi:hypothetical protein
MGFIPKKCLFYKGDMKDILVLSTWTEYLFLIFQVLSTTYTVKHATDIETMALHILSPFDLIISDITLLEQTSKNRVSPSLQDNPFMKINLVQYLSH